MPKNDSKPHGRFHTTHWTLVDAAGHGHDDVARRQALTELLKRYLPPLRAHLILRRGVPQHRVDDLLQDFLLSKVLEQNLIAKAQRSKGKFRTFLLTALDRFVFNELRDAARSGQPASLEDWMQPGQDRDDIFETEWAKAVLHQAIEGMKRQCADSARPEVWQIFEARILLPTLEQADPVSYEQLVQQLRLRSPAHASNLLITAKRMFNRQLWTVIGQYEKSDQDIEAEINDLKQILARRGAGGAG